MSASKSLRLLSDVIVDAPDSLPKSFSRNILFLSRPMVDILPKSDVIVGLLPENVKILRTPLFAEKGFPLPQVFRAPLFA